MTLHNTYYTLEDNCQINSKAPKRQGKLFKHFCRPILNPTESPNRMSFRNCSLELQHKICEALLLCLLHWNLVSEREHFCQKAFNEMMDKPPSIPWWYMQIWECKYICIYDMTYANTVFWRKTILQYLMHLHSEKYIERFSDVLLLHFMWMKRMTEVTIQCKTDFWFWSKMPAFRFYYGKNSHIRRHYIYNAISHCLFHIH